MRITHAHHGVERPPPPPPPLAAVGAFVDGAAVGVVVVGAAVGTGVVGADVGEAVGADVGEAVGAVVGGEVGAAVGAAEGDVVGAAVGASVSSEHDHVQLNVVQLVCSSELMCRCSATRSPVAVQLGSANRHSVAGAPLAWQYVDTFPGIGSPLQSTYTALNATAAVARSASIAFRGNGGGFGKVRAQAKIAAQKPGCPP